MKSAKIARHCFVLVQRIIEPTDTKQRVGPTYSNSGYYYKRE